MNSHLLDIVRLRLLMKQVMRMINVNRNPTFRLVT